MKKKVLTKLLTFILIAGLLFGGVLYGNAKRVEAATKTLNIKASDFNSGKSEINNKTYPYLLRVAESRGYTDVNLVLDEDMHLGFLQCYANLTISGDHKLYMDTKDFQYGDISVYGDLTVNKGASIVFDHNEPDIVCRKNTNNSEIGGNIYYYGNIEGKYLCNIIAASSLNLSGANVKIDTCDSLFTGNFAELKIINSNIEILKVNESLIRAGFNIDIKNSSIKVDDIYNAIIVSQNGVNIENSNLNIPKADNGIFAYYSSLNISGNINIHTISKSLVAGEAIKVNGGNITLTNSADNSIESDTFSINGGSLKVTASGEGYAFKIGSNISIGDKCYIKAPEGAKITDVKGYTSFVDSEDRICKSVELLEFESLENAVISGVEDKAYTGLPITQNPVVSLGGKILTEGVDYTAAYRDNTEVGTASIIFRPVEGAYYQGEKTVTFKIIGDDESDESQGGNSQEGGSQDGGSQDGSKKDSPKYQNEWVDGRWYDEFGNCSYDGTLSWKHNETGWWVEDSNGWYPQNLWQKIDGKWYFFLWSGYMDYSEYRDGCWLGDDGAWVEEYAGGHWMSDSTGWWYEDNSGWYPVSKWLWIDGSCYYFEASGYMATSKYVDGCWVGADGAWVR